MIARLILAAVFVVAGALKLPDPLAFSDGIAGFGLAPAWAIPTLALGIPIFEILTGAALFGARFRSAGALSACLLSLAFVLFYAWAFFRGLDVECSCFGGMEILRVSTGAGLLRALALLVLSARVCFFRRRDCPREGSQRGC
ncbi:MAG: MauE/DoxX family redox-associated membrane protein [Verrucomicrobiae bacterium]